MILAGISASFHLFNYAWSGVIRSPVSWHDRTPVSVSVVSIGDLRLLDTEWPDHQSSIKRYHEFIKQIGRKLTVQMFR
jgi:hypothetical protein